MAFSLRTSRQTRRHCQQIVRQSAQCYANKNAVKVVEVGPRDGLQNEKRIIDTDVKIELIDRLSQTGLSVIEATSFVSQKWVPQLGDHRAVMEGITRKPGVTYPVLVPNLKGFKSALEVGVSEIAVFSAASEAFTKKNINCTIDESFERFESVCNAAQEHHVKVRGYVSCVVGCPYQGEVVPNDVLKVAKKLLDMGCYEVSLGDTIGVGTPDNVSKMLSHLLTEIACERLAIHCHDTHGRALPNIEAALDLGVRTVDSSVGGLGGCPYADGASGNVATEAVLRMLQHMGMETGVDIGEICNISTWIKNYLNAT